MRLFSGTHEVCVVDVATMERLYGSFRSVAGCLTQADEAHGMVLTMW